MIYPSSEIIQKALETNGIKCELHDQGDSSVVMAAFALKERPVRVYFISLDETSDVAVRVFDLAHADHDRWGEALEVVNQLNGQFRFAKFNLEEDGDVHVQMDIPQSVRNLDEVAMELLARIVNIMEDSLPTLEEALGGGAEE